MNQKIALVTGTSSGIGEAIADELLAKDYFVIGLSRSPAQIEHDSYQHFNVDITEEQQVIKAFRELNTDYGIDLLVNNAGICDFSELTETSSSHFSQALKTNVLGHFHILKNFEPFILEGETHIVNILSVASKYAFENSSAYTASKYAFKGLIETCEKEWSKYQVKFSKLYPGAIDTPLWDKLELGGDRENMLSLEEFIYVFNMCILAPKIVRFDDITFLHKNGFVE